MPSFPNVPSFPNSCLGTLSRRAFPNRSLGTRRTRSGAPPRRVPGRGDAVPRGGAGPGRGAASRRRRRHARRRPRDRHGELGGVRRYRGQPHGRGSNRSRPRVFRGPARRAVRPGRVGPGAFDRLDVDARRPGGDEGARRRRRRPVAALRPHGRRRPPHPGPRRRARPVEAGAVPHPGAVHLHPPRRRIVSAGPLRPIAAAGVAQRRGLPIRPDVPAGRLPARPRPGQPHPARPVAAHGGSLRRHRPPDRRLRPPGGRRRRAAGAAPLAGAGRPGVGDARPRPPGHGRRPARRRPRFRGRGPRRPDVVPNRYAVERRLDAAGAEDRRGAAGGVRAGAAAGARAVQTHRQRLAPLVHPTSGAGKGDFHDARPPRLVSAEKGPARPDRRLDGRRHGSTTAAAGRRLSPRRFAAVADRGRRLFGRRRRGPWPWSSAASCWRRCWPASPCGGCGGGSCWAGWVRRRRSGRPRCSSASGSRRAGRRRPPWPRPRSWTPSPARAKRRSTG